MATSEQQQQQQKTLVKPLISSVSPAKLPSFFWKSLSFFNHKGGLLSHKHYEKNSH